MLILLSFTVHMFIFSMAQAVNTTMVFGHAAFGVFCFASSSPSSARANAIFLSLLRHSSLLMHGAPQSSSAPRIYVSGRPSRRKKARAVRRRQPDLHEHGAPAKLHALRTEGLDHGAPHVADPQPRPNPFWAVGGRFVGPPGRSRPLRRPKNRASPKLWLTNG